MIHVFGYPKEVGGANTELWHVLRLWRKCGLDVTAIPSWKATAEWRERLDSIGCPTLEVDPDNLADVPGLAGSIVVSFCNDRFLDRAHTLQAMGCRIVWVNCMNWHFPQEKLHLRNHKIFDRYIFHCEHQRAHVVPQLRKHGYEDDRGVIIRGAFELDDFPFEPLKHEPGTRFIGGRLSRCGPDKFPRDLWDQYVRVPHPFSVRVMGWREELEEHCGLAPKWVELLPECAESARDFMGTLHALVPGVDCCAENWPRVGLEAMAAGVPIVAEAKGGWLEMLNGSGVLVDSVHRQAYEVARLAYDEQHRMGVIIEGRKRVEELADPEGIWAAWEQVFGELA
jgi:hypothetical protein